MNIIVTIPKSELDNIVAEDEWAAETPDATITQAWSVHRMPKKLKVGDKVYFIENGEIKYYHIVVGLVENGFECEFSGRVWEGNNILMSYPEVKLKKPIPMKGFQGFRYTELND